VQHHVNCIWFHAYSQEFRDAPPYLLRLLNKPQIKIYNQTDLGNQGCCVLSTMLFSAKLMFPC